MQAMLQIHTLFAVLRLLALWFQDTRFHVKFSALSTFSEMNRACIILYFNQQIFIQAISIIKL